MNNWYVVSNLDDFVTTARKLVFNAFGKEEKDVENPPEDDLIFVSSQDQKELDTVLTQEESVVIAENLLRKQLNKKTKETRYLINDSLMTEIIEALNDRMVSNILNSLVNRGVLESAYDTESNDFIFWIKEQDEKHKDQNSKSD